MHLGSSPFPLSLISTRAVQACLSDAANAPISPAFLLVTKLTNHLPLQLVREGEGKALLVQITRMPPGPAGEPHFQHEHFRRQEVSLVKSASSRDRETKTQMAVAPHRLLTDNRRFWAQVSSSPKSGHLSPLPQSSHAAKMSPRGQSA